MTNKHTSLEKCISHFIRKGCERVVCERWVGDWTDCNILTPSSSVFSSTSFSFSWAAQPGVLRKPALCWELVLTDSNSNKMIQLTRTVCGTGLYNCLTTTCFLWRRNCTELNPSTVKIILWYLRPDAPVIYTGASLIDSLAECQYVTLSFYINVSGPVGIPLKMGASGARQ